MTRKFKHMPVGVPFVARLLGLEAVICLKLSETEFVDAWCDSDSQEFDHIHLTSGIVAEAVVEDWFDTDVSSSPSAREEVIGCVQVEPVCKCHSPQVHDNGCKWIKWWRDSK